MKSTTYTPDLRAQAVKLAPVCRSRARLQFPGWLHLSLVGTWAADEDRVVRCLDEVHLVELLYLGFVDLGLALNQMLADPRRILDVRRHLHLGALAPRRVLQLQTSSATVQDTATISGGSCPTPASSPTRPDPAQRTEPAPPMPPRPVDVATFKLFDPVSFTYKHLRERIGTVTRINAKSCSLLCDGEQRRVSPGLLRNIIDL